jgi:soluble lytic murein transglycosylase
MMSPETAARSRARYILPLAFFAWSLSLGSCQESGAFGMDAARLAALLAGSSAAPVLALGDRELSDMGIYGPSAYYYLARWLDTRADPASSTEAGARSRLLYRMAYDRSTALVRREAGLALLSQLSAAGLWSDLIAFSNEYGNEVGAEWRSERPLLDAMDALGRNAEEVALAARLSSVYPDDAAKDADALAYFAAAADLRASGSAWAKAFRRLTIEHPFTEWSDRAYTLAQAEPRLRAAFSDAEFHGLAMRDAVFKKDYGTAYREAILLPNDMLLRSGSTFLAADAGKAYLYANMAKEGTARFAVLQTAASRHSASAGVAWTALYYRARFARSLERWDEAARLFAQVATKAETRADADSARWYAADCSYRATLAAAASIDVESIKGEAEAAARAELLDNLVEASTSWLDPSDFSDLLSGLYRDALRARDWRLIAEMAARLGNRAAPAVAARISYTDDRAFELGLIPKEGALSEPESSPEEHAAKAAVRYAAIVDNSHVPLYYRALAAWRAGIEPTFVSPDILTGSSDAAASSPANAAQDSGPKGETEAFIAGMARFGLGDMALAEAKARVAGLDDSALRRLAALFSSLGRHDSAVRLILETTSRPGHQALRSDYEFLYPRPDLDTIHSLGREHRVPERLALGLVRSESLFRSDAISRSGAVGLAQVMPGTAADQAKSIGMTSYSLTVPEDNLKIGLAYFASILDLNDSRPLRAMMAYNAGPTRLKTWISESGDLPDDLLVEALGIEETRQYCRNILQATVMYGLLYYGRTVCETVGELVQGGEAARAEK